MVVQTRDLWNVAVDRQWVDAHELAEAVERQALSNDLDYRTRVLIRDSVGALRHYWGPQRCREWLARSSAGTRIEAICKQEFEDDRGFASLRWRVMDVTRPETIQQYLRELSAQVRRPMRLDVGGSASLILAGYLARKTEDIDVVDEVPAEVRREHQLLEELQQRYGLELASFQRHYLPMGWEKRIHSQPPFGQIQVYLVDVYDVFLSKLYSARTKDRDDLRALTPQLDKETIIRKMKDTTAAMLASADLREKAEKNWNILYGEPLPT